MRRPARLAGPAVPSSPVAQALADRFDRGPRVGARGAGLAGRDHQPRRGAALGVGRHRVGARLQRRRRPRRSPAARRAAGRRSARPAGGGTSPRACAARPRAPASSSLLLRAPSRSRAASRRSCSSACMSRSTFARCSASCASRTLRCCRAASMIEPGRPEPRRQSRAPGCGPASRRSADRSARTSPDRSRTPRASRPRSSTRTSSARRSGVVATTIAPRTRKWSMIATPSAPPSIGSVPPPTSSSSTSAGSVSARSIATMFAMCAENVLRLAAIDCSSPMSANTDRNTGTRDAVGRRNEQARPAPSAPAARPS